MAAIGVIGYHSTCSAAHSPFLPHALNRMLPKSAVLRGRFPAVVKEKFRQGMLAKLLPRDQASSSAIPWVGAAA
jgi:hypothetical protein